MSDMAKLCASIRIVKLSNSFLFLLYYFCLMRSFGVQAYQINATGGTFPSAVYRETTFSYQFINGEVVVNYLPTGSVTGKCNIMGYWQSGNDNQDLSADRKITDFNDCMSPEKRKNDQSPLVDFAGSDSVLQKQDYDVFNDLQMFPSLGGAVVPIYNLPGYPSKSPIIFSRITIAKIFSGQIQKWNDPHILIDNPDSKSLLEAYDERIHVVVRTDGSGTSEIFSTSLSLFDSDFNNTVTSSETPKWCDDQTDEIQIIHIMGCSASLNPSDKIVRLLVISYSFTIFQLNFSCDSSPDTLLDLMEDVYGVNQVLLNRSTNSSASYAIAVGYWGTKLTKTNWYQPIVMKSLNSKVNVKITTLQEGGFWNSHYNLSNGYYVTPEIQSLWIDLSRNVSFRLYYPLVSVNNTTSYDEFLFTGSKSLNSDIARALRALLPSPIQLYTISERRHEHSSWIEYQITLNNTDSSVELLQAHCSPRISDSSYPPPVVVSRYLSYANYPLFYTSSPQEGYHGSGSYTCYKHEMHLQPWTYSAGYGNKGVIAEVQHHLPILEVSFNCSFVCYFDSGNFQTLLHRLQ